MRELIPATLAAVTKSVMIPTAKYASIAQTGLTGTELITISISVGDTYVPITPTVGLTASTNYIQLAGPNSYEIVKPVTASPVAVYVRE